MTKVGSGIKLKAEWNENGYVNVEQSVLEKEGQGRFEVYHAKEPSFWLRENDVYNMDQFEVVLRLDMNVQSPLISSLNYIWRITNSVEEYWVDYVQNKINEWENYQAGLTITGGEFEGMTFIPSDTTPNIGYELVGKEHRSTSVGDVINDLNTNKWFIVAPAGFVELTEVSE